MAGPTVKEILLKWNIDNSNWKKAIQDLARLVEQQAGKAEKVQADSLKKLEAQKAKLKEIVDARNQETAQIEKQIEVMKLSAAAALVAKNEALAKVAAERAAAAELQKQVVQQKLVATEGQRAKVVALEKVLLEKQVAAETMKQVAVQKVLQAGQQTLQKEITTKLMQERLVTAEINKQAAAIRLQTTQQRAAGGGGRGTTGGGGAAGAGGGFLGGMVGGFASRLAGTIGFAVLSAEGLGRVLEELAVKMKQFIESTGPLQQVREQFEKLAITSGKDPVKFIEGLRGATHGLVDDMALYRNANTFLQSGIKASQEDILKLTTATVGLARAQGKDAGTAVQSLGRFFLTGRAMTLSYVTGIQRTQLQLQGMGHATDAVMKNTLQFKQALEIITKQFEAIGEPALTFTDRLKQLEVAQHRFWEELVSGLAKSQGFSSALDWMGTLADKIGEFAEKASAWGQNIGVVFSAITEGGRLVASTFEALNSIVEGLFSLTPKVFGDETISDGFITRLTTIKGLFITIAQTLVVLRASMEEFGLRAEYTAKEAAVSASEAARAVKAGAQGRFEPYDPDKVRAEQARLHAEFEGRLSGKNTAAWKDLDALQKQMTGGAQGTNKIQYSAPSNAFTAEQEAAAATKIAKAKEQIAVESAKIELEQTQMRIKKEEELLQIQYEQGLMTLKQYLSKKGALEDADTQAKRKNLKADHDAQMEYLDIEQKQTIELANARKEDSAAQAAAQQISIAQQRVDIGLKLKDAVAAHKKDSTTGMSQEDASKQLEALNTQYALYASLSAKAQAAANRQADAELEKSKADKLAKNMKYAADDLKILEENQQKKRARTEQDIKDEIAAREKLSEAILAVEKSRVDREQEITEYEFKQGEIGAQEYLDKRIQYAEKEFDAVKSAAERKLAANKDSEVAQAEFTRKMGLAAIELEKKLTKLSLDEIDIRTKAVEGSYDRAQKLLQSQLQYQQSLGKGDYFGGGKEDEQRIIGKQIDLMKMRLDQEVKALGLMKAETEQWTQQQEKIMATKESLVKYNEELVRSHDYLTGMAGMVKEFAQAASNFPKGGSRVSAGLTTLSRGMEEAQQVRSRIQTRAATEDARKAGTVAKPVTPQEIFKSLQDISGKAGESLSAHLKSVQDVLDKFSEDMKSSGKMLDDSIIRTTKALEALTGAVEKTTGAFGGGTGKQATAGTPTGAVTSGQATAGTPTGAVTQSDLMSVSTAALSSTPSGAAPEAASATQQVAVSMSKMSLVTKDVEKSFKGLVDTSVGDHGLIGVFKNMGTDTQAAGADLSNFADSISGIAGSIGSLASAGKGTGGPFQAGMAGLAGGMQLGSMIGGPIGGAIGAGVGLAIGVFSGKAKKEAENLAKQIVAQFQAVAQEVQSGTLGLGSAVTQEIQIIQQAVDQLSGKKGGRDELKSILPAMEQQLVALQNQQQQVIKSFDATVEQISAPEASQALVEPVQKIIDTYQQYVLAGGSVQIANEYLQQSFKNLVTQGIEQLNQSEQDAINNALQYNDLLLQRQELIQNTNQQIQDIMSQGVAVRQMPEGVTKARQLQQLMLSSQNQMAQMDEEIAVSQHKLNNEQQIFNLATTRVGLETQLVALQDAQIDKQDAGTAALLQEVAAFSGATPTNLPTAMGMMGLGGQYINPTQEPGLAPIPPVPTGIASVDEQNNLAYQQALAYYNQQKSLSSTSTIGALPSSNGSMGLTLAGAVPTTGSTQALGSILDQLATGISSLVTLLGGVGSAPATAAPTGGATSDLRAVGAMAQASSSTSSTSMVAVAVQSQASQADALVSAATQRQTIEQNISQLSATRVQQETALVTLKMQEINADMQRMQMWQSLIKTGSVGTAPTMEDLLQNVYTTRGRQGFGGFNGETNNAF